MIIPVVLTYEAETDFDAAADWYQEKAGLGAQFTAQVRAVLTRIGQMPELHRVLYRGVRRAKTKKFPYHIYYRAQPDRVVVIAVLHGRRDPSVWKDRA
jgi:plasmid stabilization system protein ParE